MHRQKFEIKSLFLFMALTIRVADGKIRLGLVEYFLKFGGFVSRGSIQMLLTSDL